MTVQRACEIAGALGLQTVGEAVMNIELHAISLFAYDELERELDELRASAMGCPQDVRIETVTAIQGGFLK